MAPARGSDAVTPPRNDAWLLPMLALPRRLYRLACLRELVLRNLARQYMLLLVRAPVARGGVTCSMLLPALHRGVQ
jgi:hypothetical protein